MYFLYSNFNWDIVILMFSPKRYITSLQRGIAKPEQKGIWKFFLLFSSLSVLIYLPNIFTEFFI